jgi:predicted nucleic acid-binding protein
VTKPVIVDANVLIAAWCPNDDQHDRAVGILNDLEPPLLVPTMVLAEVMYFIARETLPEAELAFLDAVVEGEILPVNPDGQWERIHAITAQYVDREMGGVDASVIACAEYLNTVYVASMDYNDLAGVQLSGGKQIELVSWAGYPIV